MEASNLQYVDDAPSNNTGCQPGHSVRHVSEPLRHRYQENWNRSTDLLQRYTLE